MTKNKETRDKQGRLHSGSGDKPAVIEYQGDDTRAVLSRQWYKNGKVHRDHDQPALIYADTLYDMNVIVKEWLVDGVHQRAHPESPHIEFWYNYQFPSKKAIALRLGNAEVKDVVGDVMIESHWIDADNKLHRDYSDLPAMISYDEATGRKDTLVWYRHGKIHRKTGPAIVEYDLRTQKPVSESWLMDSVYQRPVSRPGPVIILYHENGVPSEHHWVEKTPYVGRDTPPKFHRAGDRPAVIIYDTNGVLSEEQWYKAGKLEREDGPALITYHPNGKPNSETYYREDEYEEDEDWPNYLEYDEEGNRILERWYDKSGRLHRTSGPAEIMYENDRIVGQSFYILGTKREAPTIRSSYPLADDIPVCERIFTPKAGTEEFQQRLRELKTQCYQVESQEPCNDYYQKAVERIMMQYQGVENPSVKVTRGRELSSVIEQSLPMITGLGGWYIIFEGERGIDAGGLRRQLVMTLCEQIRPLFGYLNEKSGDPRVYISNEPDQTIVDNIGQGFTVNDLPVLYEFAGKLFANAVLNQYSTELPLSRTLLTAMVTPDQGMERQNVLMYYLLEADEEDVLDKYYSMLPTDPQMVEDVVTEGAYQRYLFPSNPLKRSYVDKFINGFSEMGQKLALFKVLPTELFINVCSSNINVETMRDFLRNQVSFTVGDTQRLPEQDQQGVINALTDEGGTLTSLLSGLTKPMTLEDFYRKLMRYWAEVNVIHPSRTYFIRVYRNVDFQFYPHTCARTIDVNYDLIRNPTNLLTSLIAELEDKDDKFTTA